MSKPTTGHNLARIRRQAGLTQEQLAERSEVGVETIRKLEQGTRSPRLKTLHALARALGVATVALIGDQTEAVVRAQPGSRPLSLAEIRRAVVPIRSLGGGYLTATPDEPPPPEALRSRLRTADRAYQANDYGAALSLLPPLLLDARAAAGSATGETQSAAYVLVARALHLTGNLLIQLRAGDLAQTALSDALDAAESAGDQVVAATVMQGMCWLLMRQGRLAEAADLAVATADQIEPRFSRATPEELAAWGWLTMGAAAAYARNNEPDTAKQLVDAAAAAAAAIGERQPTSGHLIMVSGFDASRVQMQRVENAAIAGDPARTLDLAALVPHGPTPVGSSWQRHRLDVAWAHAQRRQYAEATAVLMELWRIAPSWLRHQRYARDIVTAISNGRRRAMSAELADLASLVGCS
ncbi:helix-turn-helix domain-containing protein [Micromonospora sp. SH-82]|uniref:helix-turn-helix domain-containing protein n=1 Tax=Micromonospora sp. SH-82 TaxID=3132938 RepID=UPI003EB6CE74